MTILKVTSTEILEDKTEVNFIFNNISYRVCKWVDFDMFSEIKVNANGKAANLDLSDVLRIESEIKKIKKFIK